jgi:hypothetical protein
MPTNPYQPPGTEKSLGHPRKKGWRFSLTGWRIALAVSIVTMLFPAAVWFSFLLNWAVFAERFRLTVVDRLVLTELCQYVFFGGLIMTVVAGFGLAITRWCLK